MLCEQRAAPSTSSTPARRGVTASTPVNVSGGLQSKGHPIAATGIANIWEVCHHLRGEAGDRQIEGAKVGLAHVIGLGSACGVHILESGGLTSPMGALDGRVAIITGAGRGLGREYARLFAREGASVVVNDLGGASDGTGRDQAPADEVVAEITGSGGVAVANHDDVADWDGARHLVDTAVDSLRRSAHPRQQRRDPPRPLAREHDGERLGRHHPRAPPRPHGADEVGGDLLARAGKSGAEHDRALINTSSTSGLIGNFGQGAYGAAKAGIAALTVIAQIELGSYGVRANAIAPAARTRLTTGATDGAPEPELGSADTIDDGHPGNVARVVAYLATSGCPLRGLVLLAHGRTVRVLAPWTPLDVVASDDVWTFDAAQSVARSARRPALHDARRPVPG